MPAAFRFFDWQSWAHLDGNIDWEGVRVVAVNGRKTEVVTGFEYRISTNSVVAENYGLRLAEGVDGTARTLVGRKIERMKFEPVYWMIEPAQTKYRVVSIYDNDLMVLIVSLSSIGGGDKLLYDQAVTQLEEWIVFKLGTRNPERTTLAFLRYVRDWGPLGMQPLFHGLKDVLHRLQIPDQERIYFEYYADNCGVGDNRLGRLLAVNMLEATGTRKARIALLEIYKFSKNQDIQPEELKHIKQAIRAIADKDTMKSETATETVAADLV